ncbi:hypothetical protein XELAEV_18000254mg [Xenopus laevis]|uniref:Uncharacterized protein n=1 Tax=Xenopus laevis TaxID=8355 RepID=A0A974BPG4_XENLA|nr:hypothetical protein XELAEV_18000254mg [Xenopus laevis]
MYSSGFAVLVMQCYKSQCCVFLSDFNTLLASVDDPDLWSLHTTHTCTHERGNSNSEKFNMMIWLKLVFKKRMHDGVLLTS